MKKWVTRPHTNEHNKNSQKRKVATKRLLSDQLPTRLIRKKSFISKMRWSIWSFNNCPPWVLMSKTNRKFMMIGFLVLYLAGKENMCDILGIKSEATCNQQHVFIWYKHQFHTHLFLFFLFWIICSKIS